jgi:hypothetical protein
MDIMELGAIGELVGGVAVIGSLIFAGLQVRQSNYLVAATAFRQGLRIRDEFLRDLSMNPALSDLYFSGLTDRDQLSSPERLRFDMIILRLFRMMESFVLEVEKHLGEEEWTAQERTFAAIMGQPGAIAFWRRQKSLFTGRFTKYVDVNFVPATGTEV